MEKNLMVKIDKENKSIEKIDSKCINCGYCKKICDNEITVGKFQELGKNPICINCGQCANICPTEAITEKMDYLKVKEIVKKKEKKIVFSIAPAVRVAIGEEFGIKTGENLEKLIVGALKKLGADYVLDITFGADLTIMEEAKELVSRINENRNLPLFTSCCPSWVKYAEIFYPELIPNLSTAKSPISMQGAIVKTYFAQKLQINPENIINIVIAPCTAKKAEIKRKELNSSAEYNHIEGIVDTDYVLTTRELVKWIKEENIEFEKLEEIPFDSILGKGSGAGVIFGSTGGVMEAALRTVYFYITGKNLENIEFTEVRGIKGIKETEIDVEGLKIRVAIAHGMKNAQKLIEIIKNKKVKYDFVEVMNCVGGCINGGGQPKTTMLENLEIKKKRAEGLYRDDNKSKIRVSYKKPEIVQIYKEFLKEPNSEIAEKLLHTKYKDKSDILKS